MYVRVWWSLLVLLQVCSSAEHATECLVVLRMEPHPSLLLLFHFLVACEPKRAPRPLPCALQVCHIETWKAGAEARSRQLAARDRWLASWRQQRGGAADAAAHVSAAGDEAAAAIRLSIQNCATGGDGGNGGGDSGGGDSKAQQAHPAASSRGQPVA